MNVKRAWQVLHFALVGALLLLLMLLIVETAVCVAIELHPTPHPRGLCVIVTGGDTRIC